MCYIVPTTQEDEAGKLPGPRSSGASEATQPDPVSKVKQSSKKQNKQTTTKNLQTTHTAKSRPQKETLKSHMTYSHTQKGDLKQKENQLYSEGVF